MVTEQNEQILRSITEISESSELSSWEHEFMMRYNAIMRNRHKYYLNQQRALKAPTADMFLSAFSSNHRN